MDAGSRAELFARNQVKEIAIHSLTQKVRNTWNNYGTERGNRSLGDSSLNPDIAQAAVLRTFRDRDGVPTELRNEAFAINLAGQIVTTSDSTASFLFTPKKEKDHIVGWQLQQKSNSVLKNERDITLGAKKDIVFGSLQEGQKSAPVDLTNNYLHRLDIPGVAPIAIVSVGERVIVAGISSAVGKEEVVNADPKDPTPKEATPNEAIPNDLILPSDMTTRSTPEFIAQIAASLPESQRQAYLDRIDAAQKRERSAENIQQINKALHAPVPMSDQEIPDSKEASLESKIQAFVDKLGKEGERNRYVNDPDDAINLAAVMKYMESKGMAVHIIDISDPEKHFLIDADLNLIPKGQDADKAGILIVEQIPLLETVKWGPFTGIRKVDDILQVRKLRNRENPFAHVMLTGPDGLKIVPEPDPELKISDLIFSAKGASLRDRFVHQLALGGPSGTHILSLYAMGHTLIVGGAKPSAPIE